MIAREEAAKEASREDPASRLGEALKQFALATEDLDVPVATLHHQLALEVAWIRRHVDAEIETSTKRSGHATIAVTFDDRSPAEAASLLAGVTDADKTQTAPSSDGVTVRLLYGERYRDEVADAQEVSADGT